MFSIDRSGCCWENRPSEATRRHCGGPAGRDLHQAVTEDWSEMSDLRYVWEVVLTGFAGI